MKVVIVARTRMGAGACIGGITLDGRSVRLIPEGLDRDQPFNLEYHVGDVWDIEHRPPDLLRPPHVENVVVVDKRRLPSIDDLAAFIEERMPPRSGGVDVLFDGLLQRSPVGPLYVAGHSGVPSCSTMFWRPDRPLTRDTAGKRIRYRYPTPDGGCTLTFVGFQEPLAELPAGSLVRVSLAHWWRPQDSPDAELRCYVQLSGWIVPEELPMWDETDEDAPARPAQPIVLGQMPDLDRARLALRQVFGYDDFRPLQADVIANILQKRDTLAIMPTGSGKSLCYQLPALLTPGLTVVVSPLIALMEDQVAQLRQVGVPAVFLNSTVSYRDYLQATEQIRAGAVRLLYAAPETLLRPETLLLLERSLVDCLTIDEAHCISEWGHDFRPEYRQLVALRQRLPAAVCLAVTATATDHVRQDIKQALDIADADEFVASFDRENLFLEVQPKTDPLSQAVAFLERNQGQSGIIYCNTRQQVDRLTADLVALGWPALPYHAGLDDDTRRRNQRRFSFEESAIMVATIAFGMGINKSNVRFILHHDLPKNLESYYQQIGRAGRDGLRSECLLLYGAGDLQTIRFLLAQGAADQQRGAAARLEAMIAYAETSLCRRRPLLVYFGETAGSATCAMCDNCLAGSQATDDLTILAQKFLSCVKRTGEMFGMSHIIKVLRGSQARGVLQRGHDRLSTYGIGRDFSRDEWKQLGYQFVQQGLVVVDSQFGSLQLTAAAYEVFQGRPVTGALPGRQVSGLTRAAAVGPHDRALFELLRQKRRELAEAEGLPPYLIFSDLTLVDMATYFPQSWASLARVYGVGQRKLARYGDAFLATLADYCRQNGIAEIERPARWERPARSRPAPGSTGRSLEILRAYSDGRSIAEMALHYGIKPQTVINYLWECAQAGRLVEPAGLLAHSRLAPPERERVLDAFEELGVARLRPVYDALEGQVEYEELHLLRLYSVARETADDGPAATAAGP